MLGFIISASYPIAHAMEQAVVTKETPLIKAIKDGDRVFITSYPLDFAKIKASPVLAQDEDGRNALHHAAMKGDHATVGMLLNLSSGNKLKNQKDSQGKIPAHYAVLSKDSTTIDALKFFDADNCQDSEGKSPLHYASANGDAKAVSELLKTVSETKLRNLKDKEGKKAAHYAVISKDAATIDSLKFFDVDNCQDSEGKSPLHYAAANGDAKAVSAFLVMVCRNRNLEI